MRGRRIGIVTRHRKRRHRKSPDQAERRKASAARVHHDPGTELSEFMGIRAGTGIVRVHEPSRVLKFPLGAAASDAGPSAALREFKMPRVFQWSRRDRRSQTEKALHP
jgi:hypothetical protein